MKDHSRRAGQGTVVLRGTCPHVPRNLTKLFFAITTHRHRHIDLICRIGSRHNQRRRPYNIGRPRLFDTRQLLLNTRPESRIVRLVGHHDDDTSKCLESADQIEIRRPQATGIGRMVGDRDDHLVKWQRGLTGEQAPCQLMFVNASALTRRTFVRQKRQTQKTRLVDEAFAATVGPPLDTEFVEDRSRKVAHTTLPPPQFIVEVEHGRNQSGPQLERPDEIRPRRENAVDSVLEQHEPFDPAQPARWRRERRRQPQQPFVPCLQIRADERAGTTTGGMLFDGEAKQGAGRTGRHDDDPAARRQAVPRRGEINKRLTERRQAARSDQNTTLHERRSVCH